MKFPDSARRAPGLRLTGSRLTPGDVRTIARLGGMVSLHPAAARAVVSAAELLRRLMAEGRSLYGINTGLGGFASRRVDPSQASQLSRNLVLSHTAGVGEPFPEEVVRAALLIRANTLARGHSGARLVVVRMLLEMLNRGLTPVVPSQGSLGASGDLAPLAHVALTFSRGPRGGGPSGQIQVGGRRLSASRALRQARLEPLVLGPKEGLSLTNGPAFSAGLLALAVEDAADLLDVAVLASALCFAALQGARSSLQPSLHSARPHPGQSRIAAGVRRWLRGCSWLDRRPTVQDPYSLRCVPQILGPVWEAVRAARRVVTRELNSSTDNPLLLSGRAVSGGNFHGAPLALAADYLKTALVQPAALAERQVDQLVAESARTGLPPMLVADPSQAGLQSGLMMLQYTAASLVLECESLAPPDSAHSIPTSGGQEDLNPNAATAARHLRQQVDNLRRVLAIELVAVTRAIHLRLRTGERARLGPILEPAYRTLDRTANLGDSDQPLHPAIERLEDLLRSESWLRQVRTVR